MFDWKFTPGDLAIKIGNQSVDWVCANCTDDELEALLWMLDEDSDAYEQIETTIDMREMAKGPNSSGIYYGNTPPKPTSLADMQAAVNHIKEHHQFIHSVHADLGKASLIRCNHAWKETVGLYKTYRDCIHCGARAEDVGG